MKKRIHLIVHGLVHGVFFRDQTHEHAEGLGLTGVVKNLPDGTVEIMAEGEEAGLQTLLKWCSNGPKSSHVDHIDIDWDECIDEFEGFSIEY